MPVRVSRSSARHWATSAADAMLASAGADAMAKYLKVGQTLARVPILGPPLGARLLSLPSPRPFEVVLTQGPSSYTYISGPGDDLNYSARSNLNGWEDQSRELFFALATVATQVVDVGAYSGIYTILAYLANPESQIAAFEPNPGLFDLLSRNVDRNCRGAGVSLWRTALVEQPATLEMFIDTEGGHSSTASLVAAQDRRQRSIKVEGVRMDVALAGWKPTLMKVDVEGAEARVLRGASGILTSSTPTILMEALGRDELDAQATVLADFGYLPPMPVADGGPSGDDRNYLWVHPNREREVTSIVARLRR